jgi:dihydrofolate reductase
VAAVVIGRRLFDLTNGWNGVPAAGEHVFVVTHQAPTDWEHADTAPFTFVDGVEKAIAAAQALPATGWSTWPAARSAARRSSSG